MRPSNPLIPATTLSSSLSGASFAARSAPATAPSIASASRGESLV